MKSFIRVNRMQESSAAVTPRATDAAAMAVLKALREYVKVLDSVEKRAEGSKDAGKIDSLISQTLALQQKFNRIQSQVHDFVGGMQTNDKD